MSDAPVELYRPFGWEKRNPCPVCDTPFAANSPLEFHYFEYGNTAESLCVRCTTCGAHTRTHTKRLSPNPERARRVAAALEMKNEGLS